MKITNFYSPSKLGCVSFQLGFPFTFDFIYARIPQFFSSVALLPLTSFLSVISSFTFVPLVHGLSSHFSVYLFSSSMYISSLSSVGF
jgi:hypothetical protein